MSLTHEQYKSAMLAWINEQDRNLTVDLPVVIRTKLEKKYLKMYYNDDTKADATIVQSTARKTFITDLKTQYPNTTP